jgi:hypothetical protein
MIIFVILGDSNDVISIEMCTNVDDEDNFEVDWPNGDESWFFHNELS